MQQDWLYHISAEQIFEHGGAGDLMLVVNIYVGQGNIFTDRHMADVMQERGDGKRWTERLLCRQCCGLQGMLKLRDAC
jgi:hypothetical protein